MAKRQQMTRKQSNKNFKKGSGTKARNKTSTPMRGGYRM